MEPGFARFMYEVQIPDREKAANPSLRLAVPAVPVPASRSTIRADSDWFRSGGNNPISFILKRDAQNSDPWAGRPFRFRSHKRR